MSPNEPTSGSRDLIRALFQRIYPLTKEVPSAVIEGLRFLHSDLFFDVGEKKLAIYEVDSPRVPDFVAEAVQNNEELLSNEHVEIAVVAPINEPASLTAPTYDDIGKAIGSRKIHLYIVRENHLVCIHRPETLHAFNQLEENNRLALEQRLQQNKHIPSCLTQRVRNTTRISYHSVLRDIVTEYDNASISDVKQEYDLVQKLMERFLETSALSNLMKELDFLQFTQNQLKAIGRRDHFLHSFQVFLIGTVIIDAFYENFCKWFGHDESSESLDRSWILASLFHDIGFPIEHTEWMGPHNQTFVPGTEMPPMTDHLIEELCSFFANKTASPESRAACSERLKGIFIKHARPRIEKERLVINHGVYGAVHLMNRATLVQRRIWDEQILPAALAISLHDRRVWTDMMKEKLFPVRMDSFPLNCLLMISDHLQGWGRPGRTDDPEGHNTMLCNISNPGNFIVSEIWFKYPSDAVLTLWEHAELKRACMVLSDVAFLIRPRL